MQVLHLQALNLRFEFAAYHVKCVGQFLTQQPHEAPCLCKSIYLGVAATKDLEEHAAFPVLVSGHRVGTH